MASDINFSPYVLQTDPTQKGLEITTQTFPGLAQAYQNYIAAMSQALSGEAQAQVDTTANQQKLAAQNSQDLLRMQLANLAANQQTQDSFSTERRGQANDFANQQIRMQEQFGSERRGQSTDFSNQQMAMQANNERFLEALNQQALVAQNQRYSGFGGSSGSSGGDGYGGGYSGGYSRGGGRYSDSMFGNALKGIQDIIGQHQDEQVVKDLFNYPDAPTQNLTAGGSGQTGQGPFMSNNPPDKPKKDPDLEDFLKAATNAYSPGLKKTLVNYGQQQQLRADAREARKEERKATQEAQLAARIDHGKAYGLDTSGYTASTSDTGIDIMGKAKATKDMKEAMKTEAAPYVQEFRAAISPQGRLDALVKISAVDPLLARTLSTAMNASTAAYAAQDRARTGEVNRGYTTEKAKQVKPLAASTIEKNKSQSDLNRFNTQNAVPVDSAGNTILQSPGSTPANNVPIAPPPVVPTLPNQVLKPPANLKLQTPTGYVTGPKPPPGTKTTVRAPIKESSTRSGGKDAGVLKVDAEGYQIRAYKDGSSIYQLGADGKRFKPYNAKAAGMQTLLDQAFGDKGKPGDKANETTVKGMQPKTPSNIKTDSKGNKSIGSGNRFKINKVLP